MADVRSMLRSELASRKPNTHESTSKKRKAATSDSADEPSKRARAANVATSSTAAALAHTQASAAGEEASPEAPLEETAPLNDHAPQGQQPADAIDEDEWAAFERDVAAAAEADPEAEDAFPPPRNTAAASALNAPATITAQPVGAAELAAQAREEQSTAQRGARETEAEDEREEAQAALLDQFDEMEALEARVKKLREKREAIRPGSRVGEDGERPPSEMHEDNVVAQEGTEGQDLEQEAGESPGDSDNHSDSDDDEGEWDMWGVS